MTQRLKLVAEEEVLLCSIVLSELMFGCHRSNDPLREQRNVRLFTKRFRSLPFDDDAAQVAGRLRADLAAAGTPIGANDLLIAAIALAHGLTLVTHNTREFSRVTPLRIEDWQA